MSIQIFADQIEANKTFQYVLYSYWNSHPDKVPGSRPDLGRIWPILDQITNGLLAQLKTTQHIRADRGCATQLTAARQRVRQARALDALHDNALGRALESVCQVETTTPKPSAPSTGPAPTFRLGGIDMGGDLTVNRLGFGAMRITGDGIWGQPADRDQAKAVLRHAIEFGVKFIDTADSYGPHVTEGLIGEMLHPYPGDLVIATARSRWLISASRSRWFSCRGRRAKILTATGLSGRWRSYITTRGR